MHIDCRNTYRIPCRYTILPGDSPYGATSQNPLCHRVSGYVIFFIDTLISFEYVYVEPKVLTHKLIVKEICIIFF